MHNTTQTRKLLAVLAHPDDETFGMGGTLALYSHRGVETHLICATRGEAGEIDPNFPCETADIADCRENELSCAANLLGLKTVHFLNYRDSGMPGAPDNAHPDALINQPADKVAADITHLIRQFKPQVVLTFDPIGGYRHPDHIAIHQATLAAFHAAGDPNRYPDGLAGFKPERLYYHTISRTFIRLGVFVIRLSGKDPSKWGRNGDIDLASIAAVTFPTHVRINYRPVTKLRDQASACHASQGGTQMTKGVMHWLRWLVGSSETFMQAHPAPSRKRVSNDLFEGV